MKLDEIAGKLTEEQKLQFEAHPLWNGMNEFIWPISLITSTCAREVWLRLNDPDHYVLEVILLGFGHSLFSEEQLLQAAKPRLAGSELRIGLLHLQEAGIVFAVRRGWGEKLYGVPSDLYTVWFHAMQDRKRLPAMPEIDSYDIVPIDGSVGYVPPLSVQLLHAMAALQHTGMKRTTRGVLAKRAIESATAQLHYDNERLLGVAELTQADAAQLYPLPLAIMLQLAVQEGWLIERASAYYINQAGWENWLEQRAPKREERLLLQIIELLSSRNAAAAVGAAQLFTQSEAYIWYRAADVEARLDRASSAVLTKPPQSTIAVWCQLLRTLGYMEVAEDEFGAAVFRWLLQPIELGVRDDVNDKANDNDNDCDNEDEDDNHNDKANDEEVIRRFEAAAIQFTPDGDIYVQEDCPYSVRWQLELIAERRRTDRVTVYRMTERSYKRTAEQGIGTGEVIHMLEAAADEPLPETMRAAISIGMSAHTAVLAPVPEPVSVTLHGSNPSECEPSLLVLGSQSYEIIIEHKAVRSLFAGIESVPAMWMKQFRSYHLSTRRELMEQALSWRAAVKLSCEGQIKPFIPERIVDEDDKWAVIGYLQEGGSCLPIKLQPDMWQEMMLVLPEGTFHNAQ
ncbi:helicase-associated domain-containing protein [Paenibacillus sp. OV219]|uniref:helicase-associated domain-containing protein n=1 Tax=Paenibacillus sp. OV219 TaxID=1884377 RepID=UPI0008D675B2|nr:helicase-associated domain-containing protein [Paenibacillus sp. OV219]SEM75931.1 hypothetical protein SAMN05518847_101719 [Paenibacillus sp. OV219]